jgi:hypothetical protein
LAVAFLEMEELSEPPKKRLQVPRGEVEKIAAEKAGRWEGFTGGGWLRQQ